MEKKYQEIIKKIDNLQESLEKESDFFKKSFFTQEIKKLIDERDTLKNKIKRLKNLTGEIKDSPPTPQEETQIPKNEEAELAEGETSGLVNGPYHEVVNSAGGTGKSEIHYFAKEIAGQNKIKLEYLNPNGKSTGLEAKKVSKEEFSSKFISCIQHGCSIIKK